jgi:hypothetical protein
MIWRAKASEKRTALQNKRRVFRINSSVRDRRWIEDQLQNISPQTGWVHETTKPRGQQQGPASGSAGW